VKKETSSLLLLLLGGALLKISFTGTYVRYVKVGQRPILVLAGAVLVGVAVLTLYRLLIEPKVSTAPGHDEHDGHAHGRGWFDVGWLLVLPALALLLIAPPALGSYAAGRSGTALGAGHTSDFPALPAGNPLRISVLDYASRAVFDRGSLANRQLELSGFLIAAPGGGWDLARMVVTCCAADARPIKVGLVGQVPGGLVADDWLRVTGRYTAQQRKDSVNAQSIPYLEVRAAQVIPAPSRQYES
jgi:uncharacterized repeat protein (TIGR03943 family)